MPVNSAIPLSLKPTTELMTPGQVISLKNVALQGRMQEAEFEQAEKDRAQKNNLRMALQDPTTIDPQSGRITPQGLARITQIDPSKGLELTRQQEQLRLQDLAFNEKKSTIQRGIETAYITAYDGAIPTTGGNRDQALTLARQARNDAIDEMERSGQLSANGFSPQDIARLRSVSRDPEATRALVTAMGGSAQKTVWDPTLSGKLEPKDYDPASWAAYVQTRDTTKLRKLEAPKEPKEIKAPTMRTRYAGDQEIQEEFNAGTGRWAEIGRRDRVAQPREEKQPTEGEKLAAGYASRMVSAAGIMAELEAKGVGKPEAAEVAARTLPGVVGKDAGNAAMSPDRQKYRQAQEDWVRAKLRKESGAVIADEEMDREIRVYFPQIGDSAAVIRQKADARGTAEKAMEQSAGRAPVSRPAKVDTALKTKVEAAGWSFEPAKYDYRIGPSGNVQRKLKSG